MVCPICMQGTPSYTINLLWWSKPGKANNFIFRNISRHMRVLTSV